MAHQHLLASFARVPSNKCVRACVCARAGPVRLPLSDCCCDSVCLCRQRMKPLRCSSKRSAPRGPRRRRRRGGSGWSWRRRRRSCSRRRRSVFLETIRTDSEWLISTCSPRSPSCLSTLCPMIAWHHCHVILYGLRWWVCEQKMGQIRQLLPPLGTLDRITGADPYGSRSGTGPTRDSGLGPGCSVCFCK